MKALDQRVLAMLQALTVKGPVTESALRTELSVGDDFFPSEIIPMAISRLRASGHVRRSDDGRLEAVVLGEPNLEANRPFYEIKASAADDKPTQETEVANEKAKTCTGCGKDKPIGEFYANCAKCKRCVLDRQKAAKGGDAKPKTAKVPGAAKTAAPVAKTALKNLKAKAAAVKKNGAAAVQEAMVALSFALNVEDVHGVFHKFSVGRLTVQRLITELKEFA